MAAMEVILRQDVEKVGAMGDVVRVKPGFARNFLIPRGLAVIADRRNRRVLEHQQRIVAAQVDKARQAAHEAAEKLGSVRVVVRAKAGEEGRLFGSVTNQDIQRELEKQGVSVDRKKIELEAPIKSLGDHRVPVRLRPDVRAEVTVTVEAEE